MAPRREGLRQILPKAPKPAVKTNAQCCKEYQERVKADPEKLAAFKLTKKLAQARWLSERSEEQRLLDRTKARERQARKRMRDKQRGAKPESAPAKASKASKTRSETKKEEMKRQAAAERKRKSRLSAKQRARESKAQKERYHRKKKEAEERRNQTHTSESNRRKSNEKVHKISLGRVVKRARENLQIKRDKESLCKLHFVKALLAGNTNTVSRKNLYKRTTPRDNTVENFYEQAGVSLPGKKSVSTISMKGKKVLTKTVKTLFHEFREKNPRYKISLTSFSRRRPQHILLSSSTSFRQCLCLHCVNPMLKVHKINPFLPHDMKIKHEDDLVERTVCKKDTFRRECVDRNCHNCGVDAFFDSLEGRLPTLQEPVSWLRWQKSDRSPMGQIKKTGTWDQMLKELKVELADLANHLKTARWQRSQYQELLNSLPESSAVITIDFAENYLCRYQNEVQSAHWSYRQVTLCPSVLQYRCSSCSSLITEYITAISDDNNHDAAFVKRFLSDIFKHLEQHEHIQHIHIWSDGCSSQFKSKLPFIHLTELAAEHPNIVIDRHYFGAGHGKSLCDGSGGTIKGCATRAVATGRETIQSAADMHRFCVDKLVLPEQEEKDHNKTHLRRSFKLYQADDFSRLKKAEDYVTLKGCRSIHHLKPKREIGELVYRHLSCFCSSCRDEDGCENELFVGEWRSGSVNLKENRRRKTKRGNQNTSPPSVSQTTSEFDASYTTPAPDVSHTTSAPDDYVFPSTPAPDAYHSTPAPDASPSPAFPSQSILPPVCQPLPDSISHDFSKAQSDTQTENDRQKDFKTLQCKLQAALCFEDFLKVATDSLPVINRHALSLKTDMKSDLFAKDKTATLLYPSDAPKLTPIKIYGDGNCLPRCASLLAFGHEDNHTEMRVRIAVEMAVYKHLYISDTMSHTVANLPKKAAMYSENYVGQVVTSHVLEDMYKTEIMQSIKSARYMGILQLYAVATLLQSNIESIYPEGVGHNVRRDLHHCVRPVRGCPTDEVAHYGIMWTHTRGWHGAAYHPWQPNHFVVCVPPCFGSKLAASDFVLAHVPHEVDGKESKLTDYIAELTSDETVLQGQRGAWGVYLVQCKGGRSWKRPNKSRSSFFLPLSDIKQILDDYNMEMDGRSIVFTFQHV